MKVDHKVSKIQEKSVLCFPKRLSQNNEKEQKSMKHSLYDIILYIKCLFQCWNPYTLHCITNK